MKKKISKRKSIRIKKKSKKNKLKGGNVIGNFTNFISNKTNQLSNALSFKYQPQIDNAKNQFNRIKGNMNNQNIIPIKNKVNNFTKSVGNTFNKHWNDYINDLKK